jgi:hypothetical protein
MAHFAGEWALGAAAAAHVVDEVGADVADVVVAVAVDDAAAAGDVELYMETGVVVDGEEGGVTDSSRPVRASYCFVRDHKNIASQLVVAVLLQRGACRLVPAWWWKPQGYKELFFVTCVPKAAWA